MGPGSEEVQVDRSPAERTHPLLVLAVVAAVTGGAVVLANRVYPAHHPTEGNPNFIDIIFANNLVLFAARLTLLSAAVVLAVAAVFIVVSFWKRGKAGHWMVRFGPFETQAVEDLQGAVNQWIEWWSEENTRRLELEERVQQSDELIAEIHQRYQEALTELAEPKGDSPPEDTLTR